MTEITDVGWMWIFIGAAVFAVLFMASVGGDPPKPPPPSSLDG